jgi:hypothetical protein
MPATDETHLEFLEARKRELGREVENIDAGIAFQNSRVEGMEEAMRDHGMLLAVLINASCL